MFSCREQGHINFAKNGLVYIEAGRELVSIQTGEPWSLFISFVQYIRVFQMFAWFLTCIECIRINVYLPLYAAIMPVSDQEDKGASNKLKVMSNKTMEHSTNAYVHGLLSKASMQKMNINHITYSLHL